MDADYSDIESCAEFQKFLEGWNSGEGFRCAGAPGSSPVLLLARAYLRRPHPLLVLARDDREAERIKREMESFGSRAVEVFPALEVLPRDEVKPNPELVGERYRIAAAIRRDPALVIATTPTAAGQPLPAPAEMEHSSLLLRTGDRLTLADLARWLLTAGYEYADPVLIKGQFARRGGIVDVFSGQDLYPVRLELEDDRIASLRAFDPQSQTSRARAEAALIYPAAQPRDRSAACLWDYLPPGCRIALAGIFPREEWAEIPRRLRGAKTIYFSGIDAPCPGLDLPLRAEFSIRGLDRDKYRTDRGPHPLLAALPEWLGEGYLCLIQAHNADERQRLEEIFRERGFGAHPRLRFQVGEAEEGFLWGQARLAVVSDAEIFARYRVRRPHRVFMGGRPAVAPADFRPGDYVVHIDYGVGHYHGIKKLASGGGEREKMLIQYADKARLYVPLQQAHLITRYLGLGSRPPALDRLGGARWRKAKLQAQKATDGLAAQLLEVQARRAALDGRAFPPDTPWQKEFEGSFIYPETPDQLAALSEIKADMESTRPMDRLLCGDVGYGKTEVALRAAFKAVMDGAQAAILVPTTILAQQHYETFRDRLADYPVRVAMLSRFLSPREQKAVTESLAAGTADIVIGTHRLLQADVAFKNLGLVVIDEEQRFGVRHKERLKQMRQLVDVLTLTATPIPRTLYLSLTGARDLSAISTPPQDRLAVETKVMPYDPEAAKRAIAREIQRQGQVYYLFNRVKGIEAVRDRIAAWFPQCRVAVAHAQMGDDELASAMKQFARGRIDVLVCTTIIESGLDIPNANTLIVERAERFGLADLYQLRGRVGRFKHRAYAYFFYPSFAFLEEGARRRLQAIEEFSQLGAGFSLAVRDLEIRGAGNILGKQQHGHIAAVGFYLYCRLLEKSVQRLKGEAPAAPPGAVLDFESRGALSPDYVADEAQRVEMYRKWAAISNEEDLERWRNELRDRFGPPPEEVETLALEARLKLAAGRAGADSVSRMGSDFVFRRGKQIILVADLPPQVHPWEAYRLLIKKLERER